MVVKDGTRKKREIRVNADRKEGRLKENEIMRKHGKKERQEGRRKKQRKG